MEIRPLYAWSGYRTNEVNFRDVRVPVTNLVGEINRGWTYITGNRLEPADFAKFLASQPDLSPKAWPRFVRINDDLPATATNKILKRALIAAGISAQGGELWTRPARGTTYCAGVENSDGRGTSAATG